MPGESDKTLAELMAEAQAEIAKQGDSTAASATGLGPVDVGSIPTPPAIEAPSQSTADFTPRDGALPTLGRNPKPCEHTEALPHKVCPICLWPYCPDCASPLNPDYCQVCLSEPDFAPRIGALVDADGVTVEGRHIMPGPRFETLTKRIADMTDPELEAHIDRYRALIKQAETALDFRRVVLATSEMEKAQRADAKRRQLRADKKRYPVKTLSVDKKTGKQVKHTASLADMAKMLEALQQITKNRAAAAKAQTNGTQTKSGNTGQTQANTPSTQQAPHDAGAVGQAKKP